MRKKVHTLMKTVYFSFLLFVIMVLIVVGVVFTISLDLPDVKQLSDYRPPLPSQILSQDGELLLSLGREKRELVEFSDIPQQIVDAFLSAEDGSFFEHKGVDFLGMARALIADLKAGKIVQGGSTITQQVAKSLLLTREKSILRKIKDILLALEIEKIYTKEEILFLYLNHVYLGGGYYGIKAAFKGYFGKELSEATIAESALVAGLLVAPGKYSPRVNPQYSKKRQLYVIKRMFEEGKINFETAHNARAEKIKLKIVKYKKKLASYFTDYVRQKVMKHVGEENFLTGGFKVVTTLNTELQVVAEEAIQKGLRNIDKRQGFKGPVSNISRENLKDYLVEERKKLLKANSLYYFLNFEGKIDYELVYDDEKFEVQLQEKAEKEKLLAGKYFSGNSDEDMYYKFLKKGKIYQGVVLGLNDVARVIYVSISGVRGIIPFEQYRWAHERKIDVNKNLFSHVFRPSQILKEGDLVHVNILNKKVNGRRLIYSKNKEFLSESSVKFLSSEHYLSLSLEQTPEIQGALIGMDPQNGEVKALVGGSDFKSSQFNRALQSHRQPGSSFKPFIFASALENGFGPSDILIDSPEALTGVDASLSWKPRNYDGRFKGAITLRKSLEQSRNVPTIKLAGKIGVRNIKKYVHRIYPEAKLPDDLSISLGSFGITLLNLVRMYSIFPNGGVKVKPKFIVSISDRSGRFYPTQEIDETEEIQEVEEVEEDDFENELLKSVKGNRVYDKRLSYIMTNLLVGIVKNGTGRAARKIGRNIGGKTGTTNNYVDAWFIGFSHNIVTGVWTGFDNNTTMGWGETGAKAALPIWKTFMKAALKKYGDNEFGTPDGIINVLVDKKTGLPANTFSKDTFMESFVEGMQNRVAPENSDTNSTESAIIEDDELYKIR